ncbi:hypothetical protein GQ43DRAFT_471987 [Delitschia confertaspora ATCC 74209]|uniref:Uncharacterized protein n=1 Tax=Delitschia confertaspora ATCC 74209 TaxID=1513339 RepID=A0A9P4JRF8_9PLEO|nr:hypothetical protein GQ43DRAFT_471987 [Delitschia confertaspora ATCC 74209]
MESMCKKMVLQVVVARVERVRSKGMEECEKEETLERIRAKEEKNQRRLGRIWMLSIMWDFGGEGLGVGVMSHVDTMVRVLGNMPYNVG